MAVKTGHFRIVALTSVSFVVVFVSLIVRARAIVPLILATTEGKAHTVLTVNCSLMPKAIGHGLQERIDEVFSGIQHVTPPCVTIFLVAFQRIREWQIRGVESALLVNIPFTRPV